MLRSTSGAGNLIQRAEWQTEGAKCIGSMIIQSPNHKQDLFRIGNCTTTTTTATDNFAYVSVRKKRKEIKQPLNEIKHLLHTPSLRKVRISIRIRIRIYSSRVSFACHPRLRARGESYLWTIERHIYDQSLLLGINHLTSVPPDSITSKSTKRENARWQTLINSPQHFINTL